MGRQYAAEAGCRQCQTRVCQAKVGVWTERHSALQLLSPKNHNTTATACGVLLGAPRQVIARVVFSGSSQSLFRQSIVLQFPHCEYPHPLAWVAKITRNMAPRLDRSKWVPRTTGKAVYCLTDREVRSRLVGCS